MADVKIRHKTILFAGKLSTDDPAMIGDNYQTLTNLRYADTHIRAVQGMTKINTTALSTYLKTRNAFHFRKSQPSESHILTQVYNTGLTASQVLQNTTAIPTAGDYSATALWTDSAGAGRGRFSEASNGDMIYCNGVDACIWGGSEHSCGAVIQSTAALSAASDTATNPKDYTDQMNNTKTDSANIITCGGSYLTFLLGSVRPIQGATVYVSSANTSANTLTVKESTDGDWNALTVTSDGTRVSGKTFAQTGTITWDSTVSTTKLKYLEGYYLYWYQFTISAGSAGIYCITIDMPFQPIIALWDGVYRNVSQFYLYTGAQADYTTNVLYEDHETSTASTYVSLASLVATTQYMEIGFAEKQTGLYFVLPTGNVNSHGAAVAIDYWNGSAYASVGTVMDGTATAGVSFAKSGVTSWNNTSLASEQKKQYANSVPLYYYRVKFDQDLAASVRLDYVSGMPAPETISHYKFPVFAQGRVLLCCDMAGKKNMAIVSAQYMPQVYNSSDSVDLYFGEEGELTCGTELFSQFGSSMYSLILMFKDTETWIIAGTDIAAWAGNTFLLSAFIGCPAPLSLKTINLSTEPGAGLNRCLAIWQGTNGIYMSDGRAPIPIHYDIAAYFDPTDSRCIKASMIGDSVGFIDPVNNEYHLLVASGSSATSLNTELVYDIHRNKWFVIDRTVDLQCGVLVRDTDGNPYCYGFLDTGYMERLEYGTDFDGNDIIHTVQTGDTPLTDLAYETRLKSVKLLTKAKTTTANSISCTHYADTCTTGATAKAMSPLKSGYRVAMPAFTHRLNALLHSLKFTITTNDETIGFEPLAIVLTYEIVRED